MRGLLVLIAAVSLCAGDRCARECARRRQGSVRLDSQEVRINHLTAKIQSLEDEFDHRIEEGHYNHDILDELDTRIFPVCDPVCFEDPDQGYPCAKPSGLRFYYNYHQNAQRCESFTYQGCGGNKNNFLTMNECYAKCPPGCGGHGCHKNEFFCGGNSNECVNDLLVCDDVKDCHNGHDEDKMTCRNKVPAGSVWSGAPLRDDCTNRHPYEVEVIITDTKRLHWYPSRVEVKATILTRSHRHHADETASLLTSGFYCYARNKLILHPPEADRLGMVIDFNTGDPHSANGYVVRESTREKCALFVLHDEDHHDDDHHDDDHHDDDDHH